VKKKFVAGSATMLAAIAVAAIATPGSAIPSWPSGGNFVISGTMGGGATWQIDEYGIAAAGDVAEEMTNRLYYPLENYAEGDYFYCGGNDGSDATVTTEANGDVTIECASMPNTFVTGLAGTLHIRLYAEDETGYMARVWGELENTTGSTITIDPDAALGVYYYYNYTAWDNGDPWQTNVGGGDYGVDGSVWGAGGDIDNNEIATSAAWGDLSQSCRFEAGNNKMYYPAEANVIAAGETVNLVSFINMVFPATNDAAGTTAAFETALDQAQSEFAEGLTGRMTDGLPENFVAVGWETDDACEVEALAPTGSGLDSAAGIAAGALGISLAALGFFVRAKRRARA
jgi:hypothetical protein